MDKEARLAKARKGIDAALDKINEGRRELQAAAVEAKEAGMSVTEIATRASITRQTFYNWAESEKPDQR